VDPSTGAKANLSDVKLEATDTRAKPRGNV